MDFRKDATIRPNCFTTAQPLCLPRPSHLFFTAMIFVFAIFVRISLGENQLCFRVSVYAMSFITSPFFHIDHLDLGAFVEVQFTGHSTMLKMFDIISSDFQKVYYQPLGKKCWGNTWKSMLCKNCLGNTCQLQRAGGSEILEIKRDPLQRRKSAAEDHL